GGARGGQGLEPGNVVELTDGKGVVLGQGLWDRSSPIAARVYTRDRSPPLAPAFLAAGIERAIARRGALLADQGTTAFRLCHGEGDRVPGVIIDRYGDVAVLRLDGDAIGCWRDELADGVWPLLRKLGVHSLGHRVALHGAQ